MKVISGFHAIEDNDTLTYDTLSIWKVHENLSDLAESLLVKFLISTIYEA